jgi:hypothetical protein
MMYSIERGVPIPPRRTQHRYEILNDLEPGDSFVETDPARFKSLAAALTSFKSKQKDHGSSWNYQTRKSDGVVRIWRLT